MVSTGPKAADGSGSSRSFLTDADRDYLRGDQTEYSRQNRYNRERAIRERAYNAILDFSLLWEEWDRDERWDRRAWWELRDLDSSPVYDEQIADQDLENGLRDMVAFALFLTRADPLFQSDDIGFAGTPYIEQFLLLVFRRLGSEYRRYVRDYELRIEGEELMWDSIRAQLDQGEDVPLEKLALALETGTLDVDPEPIQDALREEVRKQLTDE